MTTQRPGVALFDFDGTIVKGDSVLPFCAAVAGWPKVALTLITHADVVYRCFRDRKHRDALKAELTRGTFFDRSVPEVAKVAKSYAAGRIGDVFPAVQGRLDWHRSQGHVIAIITASFEPYMTEIAALLDVEVVATVPEAKSGMYTGALLGPNVRAEAKVDAAKRFVSAGAEVWAYGNSSDDDAMLAMAHHAFRVDKSGSIQPT